MPSRLTPAAMTCMYADLGVVCVGDRTGMRLRTAGDRGDGEPLKALDKPFSFLIGLDCVDTATQGPVPGLMSGWLRGPACVIDRHFCEQLVVARGEERLRRPRNESLHKPRIGSGAGQAGDLVSTDSLRVRHEFDVRWVVGCEAFLGQLGEGFLRGIRGGSGGGCVDDDGGMFRAGVGQSVFELGLGGVGGCGGEAFAGWVLRSIERDLVDDARRARRTRYEPAVDDPTGDTTPLLRHHRAPSAEDTAFAGPLVWGAVADATRRGALSAASARVVLLHVAGHSMPELARRAGTSRASVDRLRDRGHAQLRDDLATAS